MNRLRLLNDKLLDIANSDKLPNKLDIPTHINDEIDEVGQSINILIDRLRYRELEIIENKSKNKITLINLLMILIRSNCIKFRVIPTRISIPN